MCHTNDQASVCAWVPYNLFKPQGASQSDIIDNNDFILGLQTRFQPHMLCKYRKYRSVCLQKILPK